MAVFGEETVELNIFNGLSITEIASEIFCSAFNNIVKTNDKELMIREDFVMLQTLSKNPPAIPTTEAIPRSTIKKAMEIFTAVGDPTVNSPTMIAAYDDGTTLDCTWLNCNSLTPSSFTQTCPATYGIKAFCQYRDRYYASNGTSKTFRVSNFSIVPATALTMTDLLAVGFNHLLAFRNRIFGFTKNKIYYTALATIGGYPETWDLNLQFIDMPFIDYDGTIHNVKVYRDKIYMFTDKGIYYLQANGDPINWAIQQVSANFPVYDRDSICINKNVIYLTDQSNIFTFDGTKFERLPNIRALFYDVNTSTASAFIVNLYPYEEGIIAFKDLYTTTAPTNYVNVGTACYYYDGDIWTTISIGTGTNVLGTLDTAGEIMRAGVAFTPYRGKYASSYIYYHNDGTNVQRCVFVDTGQWKGDVLDVDHVGGTRITKYLSIIGPSIFMKQRRYVSLKGYYVYAKFNPANTIDLLVGGTTFTAAEVSTGIVTFRVAGGFRMVKPSGALLIIRGAITPDRTNANRVPAIIIVGAEAIVNTDNSSTTEVKTP